MNKDKYLIMMMHFFMCGILAVIIIILLISNVSAYSIQQSMQDGNPLFIINSNTSEQPFNLTLSLTDVNFTAYSVYQNITINDTNSTQNWTMINMFDVQDYVYDVDCGDYMTCGDIIFHNVSVNKTETQTINVTMLFDNLDTGTYSTWVQVRNQSNGQVYYARFRNLVQWGDIFVNSGVLELDQDANRPRIYAYQGDLPQSNYRNYTIKTKPGETMYLSCGNYLTCSHISLPTNNITKFSVTYELPDGMATGTYESLVKINTSYNTSMNITYSFQIAETRIQVIDGTVEVPKNPQNMTQEELIELFKTMGDLADESIKKINAGNKSNDVIKYQNNTEYVVANVGEIKNALMKDLFSANSKFNAKLYNDIDAKESEANRLKTLNDNLRLENQQLKSNRTEKPEVINQYKNGLEETFFVWDKDKFIKTVLMVLVVFGIIGSYVYVDKKVHPGS